MSEEIDVYNAEENDNMIQMNLHDTMRSESEQTWNCSICTLMNDVTSIRCDACNASRQRINSLIDYNVSDCSHIDIKHETSLRDKVLYTIFNFNEIKETERKEWIEDIDDEKEGMKTHYKMLTSTSFVMRGEMKFKHNNIMDYYAYLESGIDKPTVIGISDQEAIQTKIIDSNHQFIYHKPNTGFLKYIFQGRDACFIRRRFKMSD
eukprot:288260_1